LVHRIDLCLKSADILAQINCLFTSVKIQQTYKLNSGYEMPLFGLGTWKSEQEQELYKAVREAINIGYRHIDCAKIYGNENIIGKALNDAFNANEVKRESTKNVLKKTLRLSL